jgi:erythromycin esterase-like protein
MAPPLARIVDAVRSAAQPLRDTPQDHDDLMARAARARVVLLGEASHGTHEFYRMRADITRRLIAELGYHAVAVEGDWPDAWRVDRFVRGVGRDEEAVDALGGFERFPTWMWRNAEVLDFVGWLRDHNERRGTGANVGFHGLDLYSLFSSIEEVIRYLARVDPAAAERARERYACFDHFGEDSAVYGYAAGIEPDASCEDVVVEQLVELQRRAAELLLPDGPRAEDELFCARQNARVALNAERYYRSMYRGHISSWNLRDQHMADTLDELLAHLDRQVGEAKVVVWAHNSHLGDARATEMGSMGELNLGQLARQKYGPERCVLVGFSTYAGTVTAASDWGGPATRMKVRPGLAGSYEALFHATALPAFALRLDDRSQATALLREARLQRAIGVIYRPETERASHYFHARLSDQFDLLFHLDETRAVEPLERTATWVSPEPPETFPTGV